MNVVMRSAGEALPVLQGVSATVRDQRIEINTEMTIGSAETCDARLQAAQIADQHARITRQDNALFIARVSAQNEVFVNGASVVRQQLNAGDEVRIGNCRFIVKMPALRPQSVLRDMPAPGPSNAGTWVMAITLLSIVAAAAYWYFR